MLKLLRLIYTGYSALIFILLLLITTPFFFIFPLILRNKSLPFILFLCKFIGFGLGILTFVRYKFYRNKNIDRKRAYVIVVNHRSNFDAPTAAVARKGNVRFLAKIELLKIPLLGPAMKRASVTVDRSSKESRRQSMEILMHYLKTGDSIFIFPEGTRNKTAEKPLTDFKDGAFRIAVELQAPILPMLFIGSDKVMPNKISMGMRPGKIAIHELDVIETKGLTVNDVEKIKSATKRIMAEKYLEYSKVL